MLQFSAMAANILAVECYALPFFVVFSFSASMPPSLALSLSSPSSYPYFAHSVMEQAKIFRSSPASDSMLRIAASVRNVRRTTELRCIQYR